MLIYPMLVYTLSFKWYLKGPSIVLTRKHALSCGNHGILLLVAPLAPPPGCMISASHWSMLLLGHTTRVPQHFIRPSVQKNVYEQGCRGSSMVICGWTPLSLPLCHSVHGCHSSCDHPLTIHGWTPLCIPICHSIHGWSRLL